MDRPLVSILIPTYNRAKFLGRCIESALVQDYQNKEIIVVDNASTDNTRELLIPYADSITVIFSEENRGPVRNWRRALTYAKGEYSAFLFSDDYYTKNFIRDAMFKFTAEMGFVTSNHGTDIPGITDSVAYLKKHFHMFNGLVHMSPCVAIFRTADLKRALHDTYNKDMLAIGAGPDIAPYLYCAHKYKYYYTLKKNYVNLTAHPDSITCSVETASHYEEHKMHDIATYGHVVNKWLTLSTFLVRLFRRKYRLGRKLLLAKKLLRLVFIRKNYQL
jgi:glycosyltransferase involved in cell wall biosynthesis